MDTVKCYMLDPNGRRPEKIATRPRLPQAAIHCPPLADGNQAGWLVYPGVGGTWEVERRAEYLHVTHEPDDTSAFKYPFIMNAYENGGREWEASPPPDVHLNMDDYDAGRFAADDLFHDMHNPAGAITVTGNCWFQTPEGWDSIWTGVTNLFDPPTPPAYTVRVQTDWYAGSPAIEVRYQLRIGDKLKLDSKTPIGMVIFVPREEPPLEFMTYTPELKKLRESQIMDKLAPEHYRDSNVMSPFSVWYLRNKRT